MDIIVKTAKLTKEEQSNKYTFFRDLNFYSTYPEFIFKKVYEDSDLKGYAIVFLGYNGLDANNACLEKVMYWGEDSASLDILLKEVLNEDGYPYKIEHFYYNPDNFGPITCATLEDMGFSLGKSR